MSPERDHVEELQAIFDALAESVVEESDDQLLAEVRESGQDPNILLTHVKAVLHQTTKQLQQRPLRDARKAYEARRDALRQNLFTLPESADERRVLFMCVVAKNPAVGGMVTAQFRDFDKLDDDDIKSCLRQLADLGLVEASSEPGTEGR